MESMEEDSTRVDSTSTSPDRTENNTRKKQREGTKLQIEKKRRDRINNGLEQLKELILEAENSKSSRFGKLEKADILDMTVQYLTKLTKEKASAGDPTQDPENIRQYNAGFNECTSEVFNFISAQPDLSEGEKQRFISHLAGCLTLNRQQQVTDSLWSHTQQGLAPQLPVRPIPTCPLQTEVNPYTSFAAHPPVLHHHSASRGSGAPFYTAPVLHAPKVIPSATIVSHTPSVAFWTASSDCVEDVEMTDCWEESPSSSSLPSASSSSSSPPSASSSSPPSSSSSSPPSASSSSAPSSSSSSSAPSSSSSSVPSSSSSSAPSSSSSSAPSMPFPVHAGDASFSHSPRADLRQDTRTGFVRSSRVWNPPSRANNQPWRPWRLA